MSARGLGEAQLALECLKLANVSHAAASGRDPVSIAAAYFRFVTTEEPVSVRDKINAALDEAGVR